MAPGFTQPLTEYFLGIKAAGAYGWQPYHLHVPIVLKSGSLNLLELSGPVHVCNGIALPRNSSIFYGTRRFITAFTNARHLSLSWARSIKSIPPHPISWRSILILSSNLRLGLPNGLFPSGFPTKTLYTSFLSTIRATCPAHLILLDFITQTILGEEYRSLSSSLCSFLHSPVTLSFCEDTSLLKVSTISEVPVHAMWVQVQSHSLLISTPDEGQWSTLRLSCFNPGTNWIGCWVSPTARIRSPERNLNTDHTPLLR